MSGKMSDSVFAMDDMRLMLELPADWIMPALNANDAACLDILKKLYPVCYKLSGSDFFNYLTSEYLNTYPSSRYSIQGESFPDLIARLLTGKAVFLAELASFEWAYSHANKHSFLLSTHFPVHQIWQMYQDEHTQKELHDFKMMLPNHRFYFLVWMSEDGVTADVLSKDEWQILKWVRQRLSFAEIRENINQLNIRIDIENLLPYMSARGWLALAS